MLDRIVRHTVRLFGRYAWFRRLHHPRFMVRLVRPGGSHWSGLKIRCWRQGETGGWLQVDVWRLSHRGVERLRSIKLALTAMDDVEPCPVFGRRLRRDRASV